MSARKAETAIAAAHKRNPHHGGTYLRDAETGELSRRENLSGPLDGAPVLAAAPTAETPSTDGTPPAAPVTPSQER